MYSWVPFSNADRGSEWFGYASKLLVNCKPVFTEIWIKIRLNMSPKCIQLSLTLSDCLFRQRGGLCRLGSISAVSRAHFPEQRLVIEPSLWSQWSKWNLEMSIFFGKDLIKLKNLTMSNTVKLKAEPNLPNFHKSIFERANIEPELW